jgi:hypothetical protein
VNRPEKSRSWSRLRKLVTRSPRPTVEIIDPQISSDHIAAAATQSANIGAAETTDASTEAAVNAVPSTLSDDALATLVAALDIAEGELLEGPPRRAGQDFIDLMHETYPSVADDVITLATKDPTSHIKEWLQVARLMYDARRSSTSSMKAEARERALCVAVSHALEAQARSSARLAGWKDEQLNEPWPKDPQRAGETVWEHYLCNEASIVRSSLHGEAVGTWLGALGDMWEAADRLLNLLDAPFSDDVKQDRLDARIELRAALSRVHELALW